MTFDLVRAPSEFTRNIQLAGLHRFDAPVDPRAAGELLRRIRSERRFDSSLFLSEAEFDDNPQHRGVNPRPGRNLLETYEGQLGFVENDPGLRAGLTELLGPDHRIIDRKIVCGVPEKHLPGWLRTRISGNAVNNLGPYVRPAYRDITYFYGIDYHQDLIDFKDQDANFLTLYVYLHPVTASDAPLFLLEGSHRLGAAVFPHRLAPSGPGTWRYANPPFGDMDVNQIVLTGGAGQAAMWHACTLHGTQPDAADEERISLRYLFAQGPSRTGSISRVNSALLGPTRLESTRVDLGQDGAPVIKHNSVNQAAPAQ